MPSKREPRPKKLHSIPSTSLGDAGDMKCSHEPCRRLAVCNGGDWQLPFCREHLEALPIRLYRQLSALADKPVYDLDAVADAIRLVAKARLVLLKARAK